jgi:hypothetical protein
MKSGFVLPKNFVSSLKLAIDRNIYTRIVTGFVKEHHTLLPVLQLKTHHKSSKTFLRCIMLYRGALLQRM